MCNVLSAAETYTSKQAVGGYTVDVDRDCRAQRAHIETSMIVFGMQSLHDELLFPLSSLFSITSLAIYPYRILLITEIGTVAHMYHSM